MEAAVLRRRAGVLALLAATVVFAYVVQGVASPQLSHYALVRALASGTAKIDATRFETGDVPTADFAYYHGHYYSNKAPGLALVTTPVFLVARAAGVRDTGDPRLMLWVLGLVVVVLPATVLLFLVRWAGERVEPGYGTAAAVTLGLGTLLTPFATMFFPHVLSACLVFAAFVLLWRASEEPRRLWLSGAAGLLAGFAVTVEYSNALAAAVLALLLMGGRDRLRRAAAYGLAVLAGAVPVPIYNQWAYGSATHLSYSNTVKVPGRTGHDVFWAHGGDLVGGPSLSAFTWILLHRWGLLVLAPVLVLGALALVVLYRRGLRLVAVTAGAVALLYPVYVSAYYEPVGQIAPGPRFLLQTVPFLAFPLAIAFRRFPLPTLALAAASIALTFVLLLTQPLLAWNGGVLHRLATHGREWTYVVPDLAVVSGSVRFVPLLVAFAVALGLAVVATPRPAWTTRGAAAAGIAFAGWIVVALLGSKLLSVDVESTTLAGAAADLALVALVVLVAAAVHEPRAFYPVRATLRS